jgi:signal transduction histidine kinase
MGNGRKGNGLRNMSKRIESLGGELWIESALHKGTTIKISINLAKTTPT